MTDMKTKIDQILNLFRGVTFDLVDELQKYSALNTRECLNKINILPPATKPENIVFPTELLWTIRQAAKSLGICEKTLWTLTQTKEIRCIRIGRVVRYDPADLREWINRKKSEVTQ